jgi:hypothetical protein
MQQTAVDKNKYETLIRVTNGGFYTYGEDDGKIILKRTSTQGVRGR